jgi:hypothetical protein
MILTNSHKFKTICFYFLKFIYIITIKLPKLKVELYGGLP